MNYSNAFGHVERDFELTKEPFRSFYLSLEEEKKARRVTGNCKREENSESKKRAFPVLASQIYATFSCRAFQGIRLIPYVAEQDRESRVAI